jgi:hypothetical protein
LGQFKNGRRDGCMIEKSPDGKIVNYLQFKNNLLDGYGILTYKVLYHGEFKGNLFDGYGLMKYANKDEYNGQWKSNKRHGEGFFKEASTGRVERRIYEYDEVKEVLEVIYNAE